MPPPPKKPSPPPASRRAKDDSTNDSTVLAPRPEMTDDELDDLSDGIIFDSQESTGNTVVGREKPVVPSISSSDISLIDAQPASFDNPPRTDVFGDGAMVEDYNPPTEVLKLAISAAEEEEPPVEVRKWKMGNPSPIPSPIADPAAPPPARPPGRSMFNLPPSEQGFGGTRVDALGPAARPVTLDVDELRRNLEEAERLLKTVKQQVAALDLVESRGTNAQIAAALHRLGEALAMLRRS
jgi:hypothetical protein